MMITNKSQPIVKSTICPLIPTKSQQKFLQCTFIRKIAIYVAISQSTVKLTICPLIPAKIFAVYTIKIFAAILL